MSRLHLQLLAPAILGALFSAGCTKESRQADTRTETEATRARTETEKPKEFADVRFVNASTRPLDLYFGDQKVHSNVAPGEMAAVTRLPAERHVFKIFTAGATPDLAKKTETPTNTEATRGTDRPANEPLAENSEGLGEGKRYTVIAVHKGPGLLTDDDKPIAQRELTLRVDSDAGDAPDASKAKVRVIHEANSVKEVSVIPMGQKDPLWDGIDFNSTTPWKEVDPASYNLEVRQENKKTAMARIPAKFEAGKLYTYILMDGGKGKGTVNVVPVVETPAEKTRARTEQPVSTY